MIDPADTLMLQLLRHEFFGEALEARTLTHDEFNALMNTANRQTVTGLVGDALMRSGFKLEGNDAIVLYTTMQQIERSNTLVDKGLEAFARMCNKESYRYIVVKGQMMNAIYPKPSTRMAGDIDLYFVGDDYERAKKNVEQRIGYKLDKLSDGKHVEVTVGGVTYELHNILSQLASRRHQEYFNKMIDDAILGGVSHTTIRGVDVPTLRPSYNVVFIFMHLFFHMTASGVGLRQLCDFANLLRVEHENVDTTLMTPILHNLGYERAFRAIGAFAVDMLGLPEEWFPYDLSQADHRWAKTILRNVLQSGNFGRSRRHVKKLGVIHSLESGWLSAGQALTFYRLAPQEILLRAPNLAQWFLERFKIKSHKKK